MVEAHPHDHGQRAATVQEDASGEENPMALFKKKGADAPPEAALPAQVDPETHLDVHPAAPPMPGAAPMLPPELRGAEARLQENDLVNPNAGRKKGPSAAVLGGGAFALAASALGAWYFLGGQQAPEEDTSAPLMAASSPRSAPDASAAAGDSAEPTSAPAGASLRPNSPESARTRITTASRRTTTTTRTTARAGATPGSGAATTTTTTTTRKGAARPLATGVAQRGVSVPVAKKVAAARPGRVGVRPPTVPAGAPVFAPPVPGQAPRLAPVEGAPTPVAPRDGLEGTPGRRGGRNEIVLSRPLIDPRALRASGPLTPAMRTQLKTLWNQGAAAKQRGDFAAARRAWGQILQIRPGHPGIQDAIDKLES